VNVSQKIFYCEYGVHHKTLWGYKVYCKADAGDEGREKSTCMGCTREMRIMGI
jgi:hypothetical protein